MSEKSENEIPQVGEVDLSKKTSPILDEDITKENEIKVRDTPCWFNGAQYSTGAKICSAGRTLTCSWNGRWHTGGSC